MLAEGVLTRARMRAPIQEFCFLLSQVSQWIELKNLLHPKKRRVVLCKVTGRFVKSDGLFNAK